ncbi:hypothetical protein ACEPP6_06905 [Bacillus rugosus]|uniref:hypothetical protein n=1 Tax=Bacillus rugosus TaxID=2715209 RepID=UPI0035A2E928
MEAKGCPFETLKAVILTHQGVDQVSEMLVMPDMRSKFTLKTDMNWSTEEDAAFLPNESK